MPIPVNPKKKCVVLVSGGLDSLLVLELCKRYSWATTALTVDYGQENGAELEAAQSICNHYDIPQFCMTTEFPVDSRITGGGDKSGSWVVPGRNAALLSLALSLAEFGGLNAIFIGANANDYEDFPDCRPAFFEAFEKVAEISAGRKIQVTAPLVMMRKADIVRTLSELGAPAHLAVTCYNWSDSRRPCGECGSCVVRADAYQHVGITDPGR